MTSELFVKAMPLVMVIGLFGGFGGLIGALLKTHAVNAFSDRSQRATGAGKDADNIYLRQFVLPCPLNPSRPKRLGFAGDFIVGVAAGISVYMGLEGVLGVDLGKMADERDVLRVVALGIISGYMGAQLLDGVALVVGKHLNAQQAKLSDQQQKHLIALKRQEEKLHAKEQVSRLLRFSGHFRRGESLEKAQSLCEEALACDPGNINAKIELLLIRRRYASKQETDRKNKLLSEVIDDFSNIINDDPNNGRAFYNRACCRIVCFGGEAREEILEDLKEAFERDALYQHMVCIDDDFKCLKDDLDFKRLMDQYRWRNN